MGIAIYDTLDDIINLINFSKPTAAVAESKKKKL